MRRRTVQPENRLYVLLLRTPVTPFDSANFTKNVNCSEEWNVFGNGKCELSANQERKNEGANFWQGKVQNSSPILRCNFLARKSAKLIANFSATMVTSLPSTSLSLYLSLSLSHRAYLTHNIGNASAFPIIYARERVKLSEIFESLAEVVLEIISKVYLGREHNIPPPPTLNIAWFFILESKLTLGLNVWLMFCTPMTTFFTRF